MKVIWRRAALRDLNDIWNYIANDNPAAATRLEQRIRQRVTAQADFPLAAQKNARGSGFRMPVAGTRYIVIYRVERQGLIVDAVFHGARDR
jgi:toxin ParE1/3/4